MFSQIKVEMDENSDWMQRIWKAELALQNKNDWAICGSAEEVEDDAEVEEEAVEDEEAVDGEAEDEEEDEAEEEAVEDEAVEDEDAEEEAEVEGEAEDEEEDEAEEEAVEEEAADPDARDDEDAVNTFVNVVGESKLVDILETLLTEDYKYVKPADEAE